MCMFENIFYLISTLKMKNRGSERINVMPRVTQLLTAEVGIWTQVSQITKPVFFPYYLGCDSEDYVKLKEEQVI